MGLPTLLLLSGEQCTLQPTYHDTCYSMQKRLAAEMKLAPRYVQLSCGSEAIEPIARLSDLECDTVQVVVLPYAPNEHLLQCLLECLGYGARKPRRGVTREKPSLVSILVESHAGKAIVEESIEFIRSIYPKEVAVVGNRVRFQIQDLLENLQQEGIA